MTWQRVVIKGKVIQKVKYNTTYWVRQVVCIEIAKKSCNFYENGRSFEKKIIK